MVKHKAISAENLMCMTFKHPDCTVQFSSSSTLGHAFQQSIIPAEGQMN
jgi:hypothetical protein